MSNILEMLSMAPVRTAQRQREISLVINYYSSYEEIKLMSDELDLSWFYLKDKNDYTLLKSYIQLQQVNSSLDLSQKDFEEKETKNTLEYISLTASDQTNLEKADLVFINDAKKQTFEILIYDKKATIKNFEDYSKILEFCMNYEKLEVEETKLMNMFKQQHFTNDSVSNYQSINSNMTKSTISNLYNKNSGSKSVKCMGLKCNKTQFSSNSLSSKEYISEFETEIKSIYNHDQENKYNSISARDHILIKNYIYTETDFLTPQKCIEKNDKTWLTSADQTLCMSETTNIEELSSINVEFGENSTINVRQTHKQQMPEKTEIDQKSPLTITTEIKTFHGNKPHPGLSLEKSDEPYSKESHNTLSKARSTICTLSEVSSTYSLSTIPELKENEHDSETDYYSFEFSHIDRVDHHDKNHSSEELPIQIDLKLSIPESSKNHQDVIDESSERQASSKETTPITDAEEKTSRTDTEEYIAPVGVITDCEISNIRESQNFPSSFKYMADLQVDDCNYSTNNFRKTKSLENFDDNSTGKWNQDSFKDQHQKLLLEIDNKIFIQNLMQLGTKDSTNINQYSTNINQYSTNDLMEEFEAISASSGSSRRRHHIPICPIYYIDEKKNNNIISNSPGAIRDKKVKKPLKKPINVNLINDRFQRNPSPNFEEEAYNNLYNQTESDPIPNQTESGENSDRIYGEMRSSNVNCLSSTVKVSVGSNKIKNDMRIEDIITHKPTDNLSMTQSIADSEDINKMLKERVKKKIEASKLFLCCW